MEQLPYDDLVNLAYVIRGAYTGDAQNQKKAMDNLELMGQDPVRFASAMSSLITAEEQTTEETIQFKKRTCLFLRAVLASPSNKPKALEKKELLMSLLLNLLFSDKIEFEFKPLLQASLNIFYSSSTTDFTLEDQGFMIARERLKTGELQNCYSALLLINTIINSSKMPQELVAGFFSKLCDSITQTGTLIVNGIIKELQEFAKQKLDRNLVIANVYTGSTVLKIWADVIEKFTTLLGKKERDLTKQINCLVLMVSQDKILETLGKILILYLPLPEVQMNQSIFCASGVQQIDDNFNNMKMSVLECFNFVLDNIQSQRNLTTDTKINRFFGFMRSTGAKYVMDGVINFCKQANLEAIEDNNVLSLLLLEALKFLTKLSLEKELYSAFLNRRPYLVVDVCFPLLRTGTQEIVDMQEDPDQFANLALDTCQRQEFETVKTQAAQLLEQLCQNIDGYLSFTIFMCLQMIDFSLASDNVPEIPQKYPRLKDYQNSSIIANTSSETRVETCILVLSVISYQMDTRDDLLRPLERMFHVYHEYFAGASPSPLLQSRLCLFFGFYINHLYKLPEHQEFFKLYLSFLVKCAGITDEESMIVTEQANHALSFLFDPLKGVNERLIPFIPDIFEKFAVYIKDAKSSQFFETLFALTRTYPEFVKANPQALIEIIRLLVERTVMEYEEYKTHDNPEDKTVCKHNLNNMVNTIRNIAEKPEYINDYQEAIEEIMKPLFAYIENDHNVPFEEDMLAYAASVISKKKQVTNLFWNLFKLFPRMLEKSQGVIGELFFAFNQLIIHGKLTLNADPEAIGVLVKMLVDCLNPTHPDANQKNISEAALLLQLCMQYLQIPNEIWEKIILASLEKIKTIHKGFLLARLGEVFLIAFLVNFELTQAIIAHQNDLGFIIHLLLVNLVAFESHRYDRKVFLIGFSHLVVQQNLHEEVHKRLPQIFGIIVPLFKYVETIEQIEVTKQEAKKEEDSDDEDFFHAGSDPEFLKQFMKDMIKDIGLDKDGIPDGRNLLNNINDQMREGFSDEEKKNDDTNDSDDLDDSDFVMIMTNEDEANKVLEQFETEFKGQDEFLYFREVVMKLKEDNTQRLEDLYKSLTPQKQMYLKEALHSQRVVLNELEGTSQARRVVKARARKAPTEVQSIFMNSNQSRSGPE